jgi:membrane-associated protease RseP (regulator of RpoE activity)
VSLQGYSPGAGFPSPTNGSTGRIQGLWQPRRPRYWLHLLLLALTLATTTGMGALMVENFRRNLPAFDVERDMGALVAMWSHPLSLLSGLPFSVALLTILLAHEFGHYLTCRYYRVNASLPYFIPAPTFIGTFGAFIRISSPIYSRQVLFDIGIAGPLAGFVFLLPVLAIGLAFSKVLPGIAHRGDLIFGMPPLVWLLEKVIFPGVATADIYLHPVARAAWVGIFATALNLLPIGQLDGGHILYSFFGERHKLLSKIFIAGLIPLGFLYWPWFLWAVLLAVLGRRHPSIFDTTRLDAGRRWLGALALLIFCLCFMPAPIIS